MSQTATTAEPPEGFIEDWNDSIWNVGFVFMWSPVYDDWLSDGRITVKPGDTLPEAWDRARPDQLFTPKDFNIFFTDS
jgi:hypothetical protein